MRVIELIRELSDSGYPNAEIRARLSDGMQTFVVDSLGIIATPTRTTESKPGDTIVVVNIEFPRGD